MPIAFSVVLRANNLNGRLRANITSERGVLRNELQRRASRVRDKARQLARERSEESSGALPASIRYSTAKRGDGWAAQVGSDLPHALWTEEGTGVFGPRGTWITPTSGTYMVFQSRRGGIVFAGAVRGQPGKHYLRDAIIAFRE